MKGRSCPDLTASFGDDFGQFGGIFLSCQMIWRDLACLLSLHTCFLSIFTHKSRWHPEGYSTCFIPFNLVTQQERGEWN